MQKTNRIYYTQPSAHLPIWTLITTDHRPYKINQIIKPSYISRLPETDTYRSMVKKYFESPTPYAGIAEVWDSRLSESTGLEIRADGARYSDTIHHMIEGNLRLKEVTWKNYIKLNKPIQLDEASGTYYSESITQFKVEQTQYVLYEGTPAMDPEGQDDRHLREKHKALLDKISENTESIDFWTLYNGDTSAYDHDPHTARWGLLSILCKWTNFDVPLTKELFEGSYLYHPGWEQLNKFGMTTTEQVIRKILHDRPIFHKNEIEGFLNVHYELRYNIVRGKPEVQYGELFEQLDDFQFNSIHRHIQNKGGKITAQALKQLLSSDFVEPFHPFTSYFEELPQWKKEDGNHVQELADIIQTTDPSYWSWSLKKWLVGVVATALEPKNTNHQVLILNGPQGIGKSTFLEYLLPSMLDGYLFSGQIDPASKDSLAHLAECLLVNLDELDSLTRKKEAALKELITKTEIRYRRPYGYFAQSYTRHASLMGSVNHDGILSDSSGNRRFLVHKVTSIDLEKLKHIDMDLVWAQVYYDYKQGYRFWFDKDDIERISAHNKQFEILSPQEELLLNEYEPAGREESTALRLTATELLRRLYKDRLPSNEQSAVIKLGQALAKHNFDSILIRSQRKWLVKPTHNRDWLKGTHSGG